MALAKWAVAEKVDKYANVGEPKVLTPKATLMSFAYKNRAPHDFRDANGISSVIVDLRPIVRNPWRNLKLRKLNGLSKEVQEFVARCVRYTMNSGAWVGKARYRPIAFGCSGGRHRSVAVAELVAARLREQGFDVNVIHRDLKVKP